jgi:hypothetical protein
MRTQRVLKKGRLAFCADETLCRDVDRLAADEHLPRAVWLYKEIAGLVERKLADHCEREPR